jgi:hypothetical protein
MKLKVPQNINGKRNRIHGKFRGIALTEGIPNLTLKNKLIRK